MLEAGEYTMKRFAGLYGMEYGGYDIRFHVREGVLTVCEVVKLE